MPIYDFKCTCGHTGELQVAIQDRDLVRVCPRCWERSFRRLFTPPEAIHIRFEESESCDNLVRDVTRKVVRKQKEKGVGPIVNDMKRTNHGKRKPPPQKDNRSVKTVVKQMKQAAKDVSARNWRHQGVHRRKA